MQRRDRALLDLVLVDQELLALHLVIGLHLLGRHGVGHGVDQALGDFHHVVEVVAHHDVGEQAEHGVLGTLFVVPAQGVGVVAYLLGRADRVAEGVEAIAQATAVVDKIRLMPDVGDGQAAGGAGHEPAVGEVAADLGDGLAALAGVVFVGGGFIDDEFGEAREELLVLLGQPDRGVDVSDIDVRILGEGLLTVFGARGHGREVGRELVHAVDPDVGHEGARADHQGAAGAGTAALGVCP